MLRRGVCTRKDGIVILLWYAISHYYRLGGQMGNAAS